ncbi:pectinesterase family protein [Streptomyces sp. NBC_01451]|uniref:pectinesterase family protein n=1 Tax=Streptomyces sp. NBC_01451 TaxID=2903872 RepID=UPI002E32BB09|nr:pectinesterase family protein [Streptomyces sp. NBC_01451]
MTTGQQGQLPRRSFLASAIAVAAGTMLAGGAVVTAAPRASAATGAHVTWHISSEPSEAKTGYTGLINGIRAAIRGGRIPVDGAAPVDVTAIDATSEHIRVDLHAEDRPEFIRVFMRRSDSYVVGWFQGVENGVGDVRWGDFFTLEPGLRNGQGDIPLGRPAGTTGRDDLGSQTNTRFQDLAGYDALARQGASRDGMQMSPASFNTAVLRLQDGATVAPREGAQAILQIIVGLAEASRFRQQALDTIRQFATGTAYGLTVADIAFHNNWGRLSTAFLTTFIAGATAFAAPVEIAGFVIGSLAVASRYLLMAHHSNINTRGKHLPEDSLMYVSQDGIGDYLTVQAAIDAVPADGTAHTVLIDKGVYHEVISVPKNKPWLTLQGITDLDLNVVIYNTRCNGMTDPATGAKYGTQGSAVATFRAPNLTVKNLTISNTFDRNAHPEISPYETQAVAVAAMGDRQVFDNVSILSHQDTLLVKGETPNTQARQYFHDCFIRGDVDFIFGNATAVIHRSNIQVLEWPGGTVLAPNTDRSKKYGILITDSFVNSTAAARTAYLGRPWHNGPDASPQAVVRDTQVASVVTETHPWTDMTPDYSWSQARFKEYRNSGPGAGVASNAPMMTDAEAADYTAQKYLAGTDGWNPVR